ncbi:hypothetical protein PIB30_028278 [Stylosanthes scabra]|uniref:Uncharacterized protein n=1 Tax=Stylosanthes scabra TaxID=79078 RepID=A0ABU6W8Y6_9FABA|nr:hypothetical protein [Stylosanthes scabra]
MLNYLSKERVCMQQNNNNKFHHNITIHIHTYIDDVVIPCMCMYACMSYMSHHSARSCALLFAVNGATTSAATTAVSLAGAAEGGEALSRTSDLLLEARASVFANNGWPHNTTFGVTSTWSTIATAITSSYSIPKPVSKSRYAEPSTSCPKEGPNTTSIVVVAALGVIFIRSFIGSGSGCQRE